MTSRFLQLFKRGRYVSVRSLASSEVGEETQAKKHEERERFSVAAVAFALTFDKEFKAHFLRVLGDLSAGDITEISFEPERWGDLVLQGARHALVLEFKLGALLQ